MEQQAKIKARIGMAFDKETNSILYQLQFKFSDEARYKGYSYDMFKTHEDAEKALKLHESGEREYTYKASVEKEKRKVKGNKVTISKIFAYHTLIAEHDLPESIIWIKFKKI